MPELLYRRACDNDVPAMAEIRSSDWGTPDYWQKRIREYLEHELHPQHALLPRIAFVAVDGQQVAGLIAGHLTRRFGCDGELQWISVRAEYRQRGVATELLRRLAEWFVAHRALRICVDVEPANQPARSFYARHGAVELKSHWMHWKDIGAAPLMN